MKFQLNRLFYSLIFSNLLLCVPATKNIIQLTQPQGIKFEAKIYGDEWYKWYETVDGYTISKDKNGVWKYVKSIEKNKFVLSEILANEKISDPFIEKKIQIKINSFRPNHFNSRIKLDSIDRNIFQVPLILIDYPNMSNSFSVNSFENLMNQEGYSGIQGETGSFKDFYVENSYGSFIPETTVLGWFTSSEDFENYGDDAPNSGNKVKQMIGEAIDEAELQGIDWSLFDNDNDGYVDALNVVHAGPGAEEGNGNFIWSHKWNLGSERRFYDGVWIDDYTINPEKQSSGYGSSPGMVHIGVIVHEFGHALGLPDLYDTDYSSSGIGTWGVMSGGSWGGNGSSPWYPSHMCAWSKITLDWAEAIEIQEGSIDLVLLNSEENSDSAFYKMSGVNNNNEYFLFENRQRIGFDQTIKNTGLLIWHIDENANQTNDWHRKVDVEQADGNYHLNYGTNNGDAADIWPGTLGQTFFGFNSVPSSSYYSETYSGISVDNIVEDSQLIFATFRNLPNLVLNQINIEESSGDMDNQINPGEIHLLDFLFLNPSETPIFDLNIQMDSFDPNLLFLQNISSLNDVYPGDETQNNQYISIQILPEAVLGTYNSLASFTGILSDGTFFEQIVHIPIDVNLNQFGFPISMNDNIYSSPAIINLDDNQNFELIFGSESGNIFAVNSSGELYGDNWPFNTANEIWGAPAIADIDLDGEEEIIVSSKNKHLYVLSKSGDVKLDFDSGQFLLGTPAIGNLDSDDEMEIVFGGMSSTGKLFAINHDGSYLNSNYPIELNEKVYVGVALADINDDGFDEIIVGTKSAKLHIFDHSGNELQGFPYTATNDIRSAPVVSDIDFDGQYEIIFGDDDGNLICLDINGNIKFITQLSNKIRMSPSILYEQNNIYIFVGDTDGLLYSLDGNGNINEGWPINLGSDILTSPIFADIENDGYFEVVTTSYISGLSIFDKNGNFIHNFPIGDNQTTICSPTAYDIDIDGDVDLIYGTSAGLEIIDIKSSSTVSDWYTHRGNFLRNGKIDFDLEFIYGDTNLDGFINVIDIVNIVNHIINDNELSEISFLYSDMNFDEELNVLDIVIIVSLILNE